MMAEAGGLCGWCRRPGALPVHHIDGDRSNTVEANLIALCGTCHDHATHDGDPSPADLHTRKIQLLYERQRAGNPVTSTTLEMPTSSKRVKIIAVGNQGPVQQAERIVNNFGGAKRPTLTPAPDSIGAHSAERGYLAYLRKRYIECRLLA